LTPTIPFIKPDWPAPASVFALCTTREGGVSLPPYDSFNIAHHVGDDPAAVTANRSLLAADLPPGNRVQWLEQVHGVQVVQAAGDEGDACPVADAAWTTVPGAACTVMTADCLPVLFCSSDGTRVAAAHAGWRGLLAGVLEATVQAMGVDAGRLMAWLGPAIGPGAFEIGPEVREAFLSAADGDPLVAACFASSGRPGHYLADLYGLARHRLAALGITQVYGGNFCTFSERERFYSYRRDGQTGRMASLVMIRPPQNPT
jgi:hypothetical protein